MSDSDNVTMGPCSLPDSTESAGTESEGSVKGTRRMICNDKNPYVNVRSGPSSSHSIVGKLNNGARVTVTGRRENPNSGHPWLKVSAKGVSGYVDSDWVAASCNVPLVASTPAKPKSRTATICNDKNDFVNIRSGPNPKADRVVGKLNNGASVTIVGEGENPESGHIWYKIKSKGKVGYVNSDWVSSSCNL